MTHVKYRSTLEAEVRHALLVVPRWDRKVRLETSSGQLCRDSGIRGAGQAAYSSMSPYAAPKYSPCTNICFPPKINLCCAGGMPSFSSTLSLIRATWRVRKEGLRAVSAFAR